MSTAPTAAIRDLRPAPVCVSLSRIRRMRLRVRMIAAAFIIAACALAALFAIGVIDFARPLPWSIRASLLAVAVAAVVALTARTFARLLSRRTIVDTAHEIGRATGSRDNALVTWAECVANEGPNIQPYLVARLEQQAEFELDRVDEQKAVPRNQLIRGAAALSLVSIVLFLIWLFAPAAFARETKRIVGLASDDVPAGHDTFGSAANSPGSSVPSIRELRVRVIPPPYSGLSVEKFQGDAPIRALNGSQVEVSLITEGPITGATLTVNGLPGAMSRLEEGLFQSTFSADASGAFEAAVVSAGDSAPGPIVRAVEVLSDRPPEARITEPASDQLLRAVPAAPVSVRWAASDDLGLAQGVLKYIKSRGEGDAAKFTNGEIGLGRVERSNAREWSGVASLDLRRLDMQPGDTLVFWIEAKDRNPKLNNTGRSASLAIAFPLPELAKLNLSDLMPAEIGRFLLSQRQIIIQTQRLHSERRRLSPEELKRRANGIAADQREFKNSFNDYIHVEGPGAGESDSGARAETLEDRIREAENERIEPHFHGIPEPPAGAPASVKELTYAIRAMWDAEEALTSADTALALKHEHEALTRLKRAQAAVRYVPPILAQSRPIDLKRRYAGELVEIKTRLERVRRQPEKPESGAVRAALADAYSALNELQGALEAPANQRATALTRAVENTRKAGDRLLAIPSGDHAATLAEAAGQLRIVQVELSRLEAGGNAEQFASTVAKPLALLTRAASTLFAIEEGRTRAVTGDDETRMPLDSERAAEYFRRLQRWNR